jgi:hypothetical protein
MVRTSAAKALLALFLGAPIGCRTRAATPSAGPTSDAGGASVARIDDGGRTVASAPRDAARAMSNAMSMTLLASDAGSRSCKLLRPPLMQSYGGPAAIRFVHVGGAELAGLVFNDVGRPQFSDAPLAVDRSVPEVPMPPKTTLTSCAVARDFVYCPDDKGAIRRVRGGAGEDATVVAQGRASTSVSAAPIGDGHVVLAYIEEGQSSEGLVRNAKVMLDEGPAVQLSEEGSGATSVELTARGDEVIALMVDARVAMTPTHVRVLRLRDGKLDIGRDAVVFVGGPAERHTTATLAVDKDGTAFALAAVAYSTGQFGMAAVRLSDPPGDDEPVAWSLYPGGADPAPIAASRGFSPMRVARTRPTSPDVDASIVLEVGELSTSGEFTPKCILAEAAYIKDVRMEIDAKGAMWIFWRDTRGSHFERRALP